MATEIKSTSIKSQNIIAEPVANKPGSPEQGQIIQANGTGNIAKGIYQYSGASWVSLDNAQGDLETLRLIMSTDTDAVGFSSALNSTSTAAGNTNAVPHETAAGTGMLGALEIPSTGGDALLTEFDADKVFRYYSAGANNNNDYFGIPVDIPAQTRGQNIVVKFKYRTEEATVASSNGDFQVSVWDKSNGVKTTSTNTSTVAAGAAITVADSTGMAVGDKIWLESGGNAVNNVGNSITQAYITEVTSGTAIEISETWTPASTAGSVVVSGWLSSNTQGLLPEADSDTNKVGKDYSIAVKTEEDTEQIVVWFSNKSTTTNVIELFFDGILVSQNKFLQASSQTKTESYYTTQFGGFWVGTGTTTPYQFNTTYIVPSGGSPSLASSKLISIGNRTSGTNTVTAIEAKQDIKLDVSVTNNSATHYATEILNSDDQPIAMEFATAARWDVLSASIVLSKGDYIYFKAGSNVSAEGSVNFTATPQASPVILLESQDEIFTDWVEYTPTWENSPTVTNQQVFWRRNGPNLEIRGRMQLGSTPAATMALSIPSGLSIDSTKLGGKGEHDVFFQSRFIRVTNTVKFNEASSNSCGLFFDKSQSISTTYLFVGQNINAVSGNCIDTLDYNGMASTGDGLEFYASGIPIQGWNANFNPLLSMPLVEIGTNTAKYSGYFNGTNATYGKYVNTVYEDTLSTSGLCAVTAGTSTTAFNLLAQQKVKVTLSMSNGHASTNWYYGVVAGSHAAVTDHTVAFNSSDLDGYRVTGTEVPGNTGIWNQTAICILEAGENLQVRTSNSGGTSYSGGINSLFNVTVEKDFSNTNMAHIIKPAVAYVRQIETQNAGGGGVTAGSWQDREVNTINGESWFVTLSGTGTTGAGGTNTEFTLEPGLYKISARAAFYATDETRMRLYQVGGGNAEYYGECASWGSAKLGFNELETLVTVQGTAAQREYKLQYNCAGNSSGSTNAQGVPRNTSPPGSEQYATIKIEKLK